jgi:hypothetical protein
VTLPDLSPEEPGTGDRRARLVEAALIALIVLLAGALGATELVQSLRDGSIELATVFYPVIVVATAALAWTRWTGQ